MLKTLKAPLADSLRLSTREKVILLNGSKLHGSKFWPWENDPDPSEFEGTEFTDETDFHFSPDQLKLLDHWKRSSDITGNENRDYNPVDLVQDVATDCSVVASLCVLTARTDMLGAESCLIARIRFPQHEHPKNGKFVFKFNFNGCNRKVEIDDRLPTSNVDRSLHVFDRANAGQHWPALLEKAYLKVRGGYDFPGSNSGTDLLVMTGWIPEQVFLRSDDLVPHAFWKRILAAFHYGDVLVTVGTGKLGYREEQALGLASEHAYAIIGMKEEGSRRLFQIKNPWSQAESWNSDANQDLPYDEKSGHAIEATRPGTFWMDLNEVLKNFVTVYLNWNPGLFSHRYDVHFKWDLAVRSAPESFSKNPQYLIRSKKGGTVWLLLSKHFTSFSRDGPDADGTDPRLQTGFLSLYIFEQQYRISLVIGALLRGPYVDSPNILLRFEMPSDTNYVIVPSEQDLPSTTHAFTLSAFTTDPLESFQLAKERYPHAIALEGTWTIMTSGGSTNSGTYHNNPQFRLVVPRTSDLTLHLETTSDELAVQIKLIWASGQRIGPNLTSRDVYGHSGDYARGSTRADISQVLAGTYTIVVSTFEPQQLGNFTLRVCSAIPCTLSAIPNVEPGVFTTPAPPAVFPYRVDRILAPLYVQRLTRVYALAQSLPSPRVPRPSPIKLSLEYGLGANKPVLASTEQFIERVARLPERDLRPEMCAEGSPGLWMVLERLGAGVEADEVVRIEVFGSEMGVTVGEWGMASEEPIEAFQNRLNLHNG